MKIDALGIQAFIAIADQGSFNAAADAIHITQTGLTRRLQNLEAFLGVTLVERTTRSVALTPIGRDFLPRARRLLAELATALVEIRETGKALRGDVSIACVPTVGVQYLPRIIQQYAALHPNNRIKILDHASFRVAEAVLRREAEFGITLLGAHDPELVSVPLLTDRFVLVCRDDHALAKKKKLSWKELQPHPLIFSGLESGNRQLLDAALAKGGVRLNSFYEVQRSSTAVALVAEGVGVAVVPGLAMQKGAYPTLRVIPLVAPVISRSLVLLSRKGAYLTPAAQALYDLIRAA
ncbi:MAG TPA: LysR family transcriptional regulator [Burkholderiales bacterium]|nr:LysR family transcriptional regulator [Burkholderiales bacterium]